MHPVSGGAWPAPTMHRPTLTLTSTPTPTPTPTLTLTLTPTPVLAGGLPQPGAGGLPPLDHLQPLVGATRPQGRLLDDVQQRETRCRAVRIPALRKGGVLLAADARPLQCEHRSST